MNQKFFFSILFVLVGGFSSIATAATECGDLLTPAVVAVQDIPSDIQLGHESKIMTAYSQQKYEILSRLVKASSFIENVQELERLADLAISTGRNLKGYKVKSISQVPLSSISKFTGLISTVEQGYFFKKENKEILVIRGVQGPEVHLRAKLDPGLPHNWTQFSFGVDNLKMDVSATLSTDANGAQIILEEMGFLLDRPNRDAKVEELLRQLSETEVQLADLSRKINLPNVIQSILRAHENQIGLSRAKAGQSSQFGGAHPGSIKEGYQFDLPRGGLAQAKPGSQLLNIKINTNESGTFEVILGVPRPDDVRLRLWIYNHKTKHQEKYYLPLTDEADEAHLSAAIHLETLFAELLRVRNALN